MNKLLNLQNRVFGRLTVRKLHGKNSHGDTVWECICECGNLSYPTTSNLTRINGGTKSCGCLWRKRGKSNCHWTGYEDISGRYWYSIQANARNRKIDFNVTIEYIWDLYLKQNKRCALTGLPINVIYSGMKRNACLVSASLDRIDSSKGYIVGNVHWIHKKINQIKMDLSVDDFLHLCNIIAQKNPITDVSIDKFIANTDWTRIRKRKSENRI